MPDLKAGGIKQIKALAQTYQMPIIGYTPETNGYPYNMMLGDEHMRRESLDMIKLAMDMAKEMNAGYTLISAAHAGYLTPPNVVTQLACITKCVFNRQPLVAAGKHTCFHRGDERGLYADFRGPRGLSHAT